MFKKIRPSVSVRILFLLLIVVPFATIRARADTTILYVNGTAGGANNGTSWSNAFKDLQSALAAASSGKQIWVAAGIYKPTTTTDRTVSFSLKNGIKVYGGFAGTETQLSQRDPAVNVSILSGDIGQEGVTADNSYHVIANVNVDNTARLDGFTIRDGNADDQQSVTNDRGGGMYNKYSGPGLANLIFDSNSAYFLGGGLYNYQSAPSLTNVSFTNNSAESVGGGMYSEHSSSPVLKDVTFSYNTADSGGGMANLGSGTPSLTDVTFEYNNGGGMTNVSGSNSILTRVNFIGNEVDSYGAGMYNYKSNPTLMSVKFFGNAATYGSGGGMYNVESSPVLTDVIFELNVAQWGSGGGMVNKNSSPKLTNVTFQENGASLEGGAMQNLEASNALLTNVTFFGNSAVSGGGAILNASSNPILKNVTISGNDTYGVGGGIANASSNPTLTNVILWGNTAEDTDPEIYNLSSIPVITYSIVQGGYTGTGNLNADPKLGQLANNGGFTKTMALLTGSPAIDTGSNAGCPAKDQRGITRPQGTRCDMGAYELASTFADVPFTHPYYQDIEILYANGLTGGCSTAPMKYCPDQSMNRGEAAVFILRANFGSSYVLPVSTHIFQDDWSKGPWAEPWADAMWTEGLSGGCQTNPPKYCPWDQIPREQAVIFVLRMKYGTSYTPPSATGTVFADMTDTGYYATSWAEQAYKDGLIPNCGMSGGKPKFCPKSLVSRGLAAYMIVRAKSLTMP